MVLMMEQRNVLKRLREMERNDIDFPLLRIFNGVTGRYELLIDDVSIDAYGRVRNSSGCGRTAEKRCRTRYGICSQ